MGGFRDFLRFVLGWWNSPTQQTGGGVCATVTLAPRVSATVALAPRVAATATVAPRVNATVTVEAC